MDEGNYYCSPNQKPTGNLVVGGFYSPTNQVANDKDNDGGVHPGWLGYYKPEFPNSGFKILSLLTFIMQPANTALANSSQPKTADHTLLIYSTEQSTDDALSKVDKDGLEQRLHIKTRCVISHNIPDTQIFFYQEIT